MSYPLVASAFADLESDLLRAKRLLDLILEFREFGSSNSPEGDASKVEWSAASALHTLAKPVRTDLPVLSGAILLYLAGRFEYFVSQSIEATTDYLVTTANKYEDLPPSVRKHLRSKTLDVARDPGKYRLNDNEVFQLLANLVQREQSGSTTLVVDSWLISTTDSNMRPEVMDDVLRRVGLENFWSEVGKQTEVKLLFGLSGDGLCKQEARKRLTDLMNERNAVAHPTGNTRFPSAEEVLQRIEFLLLLGKVLTGQLQLHLSTS